MYKMLQFINRQCSWQQWQITGCSVLVGLHLQHSTPDFPVTSTINTEGAKKRQVRAAMSQSKYLHQSVHSMNTSGLLPACSLYSGPHIYNLYTALDNGMLQLYKGSQNSFRSPNDSTQAQGEIYRLHLNRREKNIYIYTLATTLGS